MSGTTAEGRRSFPDLTPSSPELLTSQATHRLQQGKLGQGETRMLGLSPSGTTNESSCERRWAAPPRLSGHYPAPSSPHTAVSSCSPPVPPSHPHPSQSPRPAWYLRSLFPGAAPFQAVRKAMDAGWNRSGARAAPRGGGDGSGGSGGSTWQGGGAGAAGPEAPPRPSPGPAPPCLARVSVNPPPSRPWSPRPRPLPSRVIKTHD